eukprot:1163262_1
MSFRGLSSFGTTFLHRIEQNDQHSQEMVSRLDILEDLGRRKLHKVGPLGHRRRANYVVEHVAVVLPSAHAVEDVDHYDQPLSNRFPKRFRSVTQTNKVEQNVDLIANLGDHLEGI